MKKGFTYVCLGIVGTYNTLILYFICTRLKVNKKVHWVNCPSGSFVLNKYNIWKLFLFSDRGVSEAVADKVSLGWHISRQKDLRNILVVTRRNKNGEASVGTSAGGLNVGMFSIIRLYYATIKNPTYTKEIPFLL